MIAQPEHMLWSDYRSAKPCKLSISCILRRVIWRCLQEFAWFTHYPTRCLPTGEEEPGFSNKCLTVRQVIAALMPLCTTRCRAQCRRSQRTRIFDQDIQLLTITTWPAPTVDKNVDFVNLSPGSTCSGLTAAKRLHRNRCTQWQQ